MTYSTKDKVNTMSEIQDAITGLLEQANTLQPAKFAEAAIGFMVKHTDEDIEQFSDISKNDIVEAGNAEILSQTAECILDDYLMGSCGQDPTIFRTQDLEKLLNKAIELGSASALAHLGRLSWENDGFDRALDLFDQTLEKDPKCVRDIFLIYRWATDRLTDQTSELSKDIETFGANSNISTTLAFINNLHAILQKHGPSRGLKYTWRRVNDPALIAQARQTLTETCSKSGYGPALTGDEEDIFIRPFDEDTGRMLASEVTGAPLNRGFLQLYDLTDMSHVDHDQRFVMAGRKALECTGYSFRDEGADEIALAPIRMPEIANG